MISELDSRLNCLIFYALPSLWDDISYQNKREAEKQAIVLLPKVPSKHMWIKCELGKRTDKEQ